MRGFENFFLLFLCFSFPPRPFLWAFRGFYMNTLPGVSAFRPKLPVFVLLSFFFCLLSSRFPLIFLVLRTIYINTPPGVFIPVHDLASFRSCGMLVRFKYVVYKTAQLSKYMDNFESHLNKLINFNFRAIIWIIFVDIYLIKLYNFCNLIE